MAFSLFRSIFMSKCTFKSTKNIKLFLSLSSFLSISCTYILLSSLHSFHPSLSVVRYILRCSLVVLISDLYSYLFSFLLDLDSLDRAVIVVIIIFVIVIQFHFLFVCLFVSLSSYLILLLLLLYTIGSRIDLNNSLFVCVCCVNVSNKHGRVLHDNDNGYK